MLPTLSKCLTVYIIGILELWGAVPAGLAFRLNPVAVALVSAAGAMTGAFLVLIVGEPLRKWILSFKKTNPEKEKGKLKPLLDKYGIPGLCLISSFLLGAHLGTAIAMTLGGKKVAIAIWMAISCLVWAGLFTLIGTTGISIFHK